MGDLTIVPLPTPAVTILGHGPGWAVVGWLKDSRASRYVVEYSRDGGPWVPVSERAASPILVTLPVEGDYSVSVRAMPRRGLLAWLRDHIGRQEAH